MAMLGETIPAMPCDVDAARWDAITRRDRAQDGSFVYSVATTGVYCRPSCPSRRARRQNVAFHPDPAAAERAGFRACKRCRSNEASADGAWKLRIVDACRAIEAAVGDGEAAPSLATLARDAGISVFHFQRRFKAAVGVTPRDYAAARRASLAEHALKEAESVTEALYTAGYSSSSRFYDTATERLGMRPTDYRGGAPGVEIRFALGACSLGSVLVAATGKGVCIIRLGDEPQRLLDDFQARFPKAVLVGADPAFEALVARVVGFIETPKIGLDLPIDVRGTAFQERVWQALRAIPRGTTASYADIAEAIGRPTAARAVARACATNPVALAIPCHRVVRSDGGLSGYAWGVERKRALLEREAD